jgi:probable rRNA maturation factor
MGPKLSLLFPSAIDKEARAELRAFAELLRLEVTSGQPFVVLFADDNKLQQLNRDFRQHDYPTDVLSFPNPDPEGSEEGLGEVAISVDRASAQAAGQGHSTVEECKILLLHGVLHLMGLDHESDRGQMRRIESKLRAQFGLSAGLIERSRR